MHLSICLTIEISFWCIYWSATEAKIWMGAKLTFSYGCAKCEILLRLNSLNKFLGQYQVWCPFALITAWHRWRMLLTSLRIAICGIQAHSFKRVRLSSWTVLGLTGRAEMALCSMSHTCSMWLRSGKRAGQSIRTMVASWRRYLLVTMALCGLALSSIKMNSGPIAPAYGRTYTYQDLINVPLARQAAVINDMKVSLALHADSRPHHNGTPSIAIMVCNANRCKTLMGHSPHPYRLSVKSTQNLDSSVNSTGVQSFNVHVTWSQAHWRRFHIRKTTLCDTPSVRATSG